MSTLTETFPNNGFLETTAAVQDQTWTVLESDSDGTTVASHNVTVRGDGSTTVPSICRCETAVSTADHEASVALGPMEIQA